MNLFKGKEEKEMIRRQEERDYEYEKWRREQEEERKELEEDEKEREEYIADLNEELIGEDTTVIALHIEDDDWGWRKQIALNFMLRHGYICVQNSVSYSVYNNQYYDLTFVKKEYEDFFKCR